MKIAATILSAFSLGVSAATAGLDPEGVDRLFRFPATNGREIAFTYAGDLYEVPVAGGLARRLTSHAGFEMFPRYSPDGTELAFTAQYDGNTEVYLMPATGGEPRRLTYTATLARDDVSDRMGPNNLVMAWRNGSREIVYRGRHRTGDSFNGDLWAVPVEGHLPARLPVPRGGFCSFAPDDSAMVYNRIFREFRTWKRYRGGMADDVWLYDFASGRVENLTNDPASDIIPLWIGREVWFLSDRAGRMNLFALNLDTRALRQVTRYTDFDIKFPSAHGPWIVFEQGGRIHLCDTRNEEVRPVPVVIREDRAPVRPAWVKAEDFLQSLELSPDGRRAVAVVRGDILTVPAREGPVRPLTATSSAHERNAVWSPDGRWLAWLSDATGENEIWIAPQDGSAPARALTRGADAYYYELAWSPDSRCLLWSDHRLRLRTVEVESGQVRELARGARSEIREYAWSPDSAWVAYIVESEAATRDLWLHSMAENRSTRVTDGWYSCSAPAFSRDGRLLYFVSDRDFHPDLGDIDFSYTYRDLERIYFLTLARATASPLAPRSDEVALSPASTPATPAAATPAAAAPEPVRIDLEGLAQRIGVLPVAPADYDKLQAVSGGLLYLREGEEPADDDAGADDSARHDLLAFDLEARTERLLARVSDYRLSHDGRKLLLFQPPQRAIVDMPELSGRPGGSDKPLIEVADHQRLSLAGVEVRVDRAAEWAQIYRECWRQMRDFFYAPNLHGVDWAALRDHYAALLPAVSHRNDLTYVIGELIGELAAGHAYVGGGERPPRPVVKLGLLGAELSRDPATGYARLARILPGENWTKTYRSPLTEIGVEARPGDYLLAINGVSTASVPNPYALLVNQANTTVRLTLHDRPSLEGAREVLVRTIDDESGLYYHDWVRRNIARVEAASGGQVGYVHIPDMGLGGLNEFVKLFYPQIKKRALVVDVRENGGGFVSPLIIERLRRQAVFLETGRNASPRTDPDHLIHGPMVCLINEFSASDGDIFPHRFRHYGLGPIIGRRTWGGVVGIRQSLPLTDGGYLFKPEFTGYDLAGQSWPIENQGVSPDIEVDNDPAREFAGEDQQLDRAIAVVLELLRQDQRTIPPPPPHPVR